MQPTGEVTGVRQETREVELRPFEVFTKKAIFDYPKTEEIAYGWKIDMSGALIIYKVTFNLTFSAVVPSAFSAS